MGVTITFQAQDKKDASLSTASLNKTYDGNVTTEPTVTAVDREDSTPVTLTYTYKWKEDTRAEGEVNPIWTDLTEAPKNAGSYKLFIEGSSDTHTGKMELEFQISKKEITVKAEDKSMQVGGSLPVFTVSYDGFVGTENNNNAALATPAAVSCAVDGTTEGTYDITISTPAVLNDTIGKNYTIVEQKKGTLTVSKPSSSGGGSSSAPVAKPTEPVVGSTNTTAAVDKNGTANITITDKNITEAIQKAKEAASKKGVNAGEIAVEIYISSDRSNVNKITVNLPKVVQEQVIDQDISKVALIIDKPDIVLSINLAAVKEMNEQAKDDIQIVTTRVNSSAMSKEANKAIGTRPVFEFEAISANGGKRIQNFGTGTVAIEIPYTLSSKEKAKNVRGVYVNDKGTVTWIKNSYYDGAAKLLKLETNHFSSYGVGYLALVYELLPHKSNFP